MNRTRTLLAAGALALGGLTAPAQAAPDMSLTRFECGTPQAPVPVNPRFSDTFAYGDLKLQFVYSCYLIKHGDEYMLWDTGHAMTTPNVAPGRRSTSAFGTRLRAALCFFERRSSTSWYSSGISV